MNQVSGEKPAKYVNRDMTALFSLHDDVAPTLYIFFVVTHNLVKIFGDVYQEIVDALMKCTEE